MSSTIPGDSADEPDWSVDLQLTGAQEACLSLLETLYSDGYAITNVSSPLRIGKSGRLIRISADIVARVKGEG